MTPERLLLEYRACAEHIIEIDGDRDDMNQSRVTVMYSVGAAKFVLQAADEIERLRAMLTKAYRFISPLSDPLPITNSEMANEIMRSLEQKAP